MLLPLMSFRPLSFVKFAVENFPLSKHSRRIASIRINLKTLFDVMSLVLFVYVAIKIIIRGRV